MEPVFVIVYFTVVLCLMCLLSFLLMHKTLRELKINVTVQQLPAPIPALSEPAPEKEQPEVDYDDQLRQAAQAIQSLFLDEEQLDTGEVKKDAGRK